MRLLPALLACIPAVTAIFLDEASNIDYHHELVGFPQRHTTFFHTPQRESKATLIYTLSEHSILGAVNPKDGSLVWRQQLPQQAANSTNSFLITNIQNDAVISAVEDQIASWSAVDGKLIWSRQQYLPGKVVELKSLEAIGEGESTPGADLIAIFQGETPVVQRIDAKTGEAKWQYADSG
jgi:outer membrane protein assembly factor BamB